MAKQSKNQLNQLIVPKQGPSKNKSLSASLLTKDDMDRSLGRMNDGLRFSFHFFDRKHEAFNCGDTEAEWYIGLLDSFKEVSGLSLIELKQQRQHYDAHEHDWDKLDYEYTLPQLLWDQVRDHCLQFRISKSDGRVHGFTINNTFYIVWLDPHHNLYPCERHGGRTMHQAPLTPYEIVKQELAMAINEVASTNQELDEHKALLEELTDPANNVTPSLEVAIDE